MKKLTALIIGNGDYQNASLLKNPTNDAEDISGILIRSGFDVITLKNASFREMKERLREFEDKSKDCNGVSIFFFAGHGVEVDGVNYLIACDTEVRNKADIETTALSLNEVIRRMEPEDNITRTSIIILDACRDNPFQRKWRGANQGLAPVYAPRGTLLAFSTSPGQYASDGDGRNGLYTESLLKHIEEPDLPIETMFKRVRNTLGAKTKQKQISWEHTSLSGEFYFNLSTASRIDIYSSSAIKDKLFVLNESKWTHRAITTLKTYDWYVQNTAFSKITVRNINGAMNDNLFVLGRNILQAAQGGSNDAVAFISNFRSKTDGVEPEKRKAILDGVIFEIFFDSMGEFRDKPKLKLFNEVFELQLYEEFKDSFEFISGVLAPHAQGFLRVPGSGQALGVDVRLGSQVNVEGIYIDGEDYLEDAPELDEDDYEQVSKSKFEYKLSRELLVPLRLMKVTYSHDKELSGKIRVSRWWEVNLSTHK